MPRRQKMCRRSGILAEVTNRVPPRRPKYFADASRDFSADRVTLPTRPVTACRYQCFQFVGLCVVGRVTSRCSSQCIRTRMLFTSTKHRKYDSGSCVSRSFCADNLRMRRFSSELFFRVSRNGHSRLAGR